MTVPHVVAPRVVAPRVIGDCIGTDGALYVTFSVAGQLVAYDLDRTAAPLFRGEVTP